MTKTKLLVPALLSLAITSCGSTTYESFRPIQDRNVDIAYVNVNADFSKYSRLMIEDMGIYYPTNSSLSESDIAKVRTAFQNAFRRQLEGYEIVEKPANDVAIVTGSLVDLRGAVVTELPNIHRDINKILEPGKLTFMIEMRDSKSDSVLLRAADTEKAPQLDQPEEVEESSEEVLEAAEHWAQLFRNFLDANLK
jgi:hypothetical protein